MPRHIRKVTLTDEQLEFIETFCAKIRDGLDCADFATKRQIIELLDIRAKVAFENGEKVIYLKCLIVQPEQRQVLLMLILPWQCLYKGTPITVSARLVLPKYRTSQTPNHVNNYINRLTFATELVLA